MKPERIQAPAAAISTATKAREIATTGAAQIRPLTPHHAAALDRRRASHGNIVTRSQGPWDTGHPEGLPSTALYRPEFSAAEAQRELGQRRGADVGFRANTGRKSAHLGTSASSHNRKCREISNPEADLQLITPPANRELFKFRFAKARKMNVQLNAQGSGAASAACQDEPQNF